MADASVEVLSRIEAAVGRVAASMERLNVSSQTQVRAFRAAGHSVLDVFETIGSRIPLVNAEMLRLGASWLGFVDVAERQERMEVATRRMAEDIAMAADQVDRLNSRLALAEVGSESYRNIAQELADATAQLDSLNDALEVQNRESRAWNRTIEDIGLEWTRLRTSAPATLALIAAGLTTGIAYQNAFNQGARDTSVLLSDRLALMRETQAAQVLTFSSMDRAVAATSALAGYGMEVNDNFQDTLRIVLMMEEGLGISGAQGAELAHWAQVTGSEFLRVGDALASVVDNTALAADEAARFAAELGRAIASMGGGGQLAGVVESIEKVAGRIKSLGGDASSVVSAFNQASESGFMGARVVDVRSSASVQKAIDQAVRYAGSLDDIAKMSPVAVAAQRQIFESQFGFNGQLLASFQRLAKEGDQIERQTTLQDKFVRQMADASSAWQTLTTSLQTLLMAAVYPLLTPLNYVIDRLARLAASTAKFVSESDAAIPILNALGVALSGLAGFQLLRGAGAMLSLFSSNLARISPFMARAGLQLSVLTTALQGLSATALAGWAAIGAVVVRGVQIFAGRAQQAFEPFQQIWERIVALGQRFTAAFAGINLGTISGFLSDVGSALLSALDVAANVVAHLLEGVVSITASAVSFGVSLAELGFNLTELIVQGGALGQTFGAMIPGIGPLIGILQGAYQWFQALSAQTESWLGIFAVATNKLNYFVQRLTMGFVSVFEVAVATVDDISKYFAEAFSADNLKRYVTGQGPDFSGITSSVGAAFDKIGVQTQAVDAFYLLNDKVAEIGMIVGKANEAQVDSISRLYDDIAAREDLDKNDRDNLIRALYLQSGGSSELQSLQQQLDAKNKKGEDTELLKRAIEVLEKIGGYTKTTADAVKKTEEITAQIRADEIGSAMVREVNARRARDFKFTFAAAQ